MNTACMYMSWKETFNDEAVISSVIVVDGKVFVLLKIQWGLCTEAIVIFWVKLIIS